MRLLPARTVSYELKLAGYIIDMSGQDGFTLTDARDNARVKHIDGPIFVSSPVTRNVTTHSDTLFDESPARIHSLLQDAACSAIHTSSHILLDLPTVGAPMYFDISSDTSTAICSSSRAGPPAVSGTSAIPQIYQLIYTTLQLRARHHYKYVRPQDASYSFLPSFIDYVLLPVRDHLVATYMSDIDSAVGTTSANPTVYA